ncbi:hypothetical protein PHJA_001390700 [Phtheirospermum japonicum]|uniref:VQ domain-containing protein n=1 Tax=Phtheirospermum japonicum TaxID=374723 RepID=A0A830CBE1_9LAMI|nr:hypothetical protein PHJA_001390700 [Phtheirospermum japonicum]
MLGFPMSSRRKSKRRRRLCRARSPVISSHGDVFSAEIVESLFSRPAHTPTVSGGSESENYRLEEAPRRRSADREVAKRKPCDSKRSAMTTFIVADPKNFRQMVQRVTGVRFGGLDEQPSVLEPGGLTE